MNLRTSTKIALVALLFLTAYAIAQQTPTAPDLAKIVQHEGWKVVNRTAQMVQGAPTPTISFDAQPGDGVAWLDGCDFKNGIIEVDIKGKDVQGASFVGVAFRGVDDKTFDAVYFRPFNFLSTDSVRRGYSVQYVSYPDYSWEKLRQEHPGKYENQITSPPDPGSFFHARIVVERPKIAVYVNHSIEPCLVVEELSARTGGWVGLWTGNYSDGAFTNLIITENE